MPKSWEPHVCRCGRRLINPKGMPHFGTIWAADLADFDRVFHNRGQPEHDVYIYKGESVRFIGGKCC